ncbi:MAG: DNA repair protein RecN [Alphaproteobacteria bacterium]
MLESLTIQNVVIIESLSISFRSGLCTLTGETGAGKSILLDSLGLATGMRAESGLVRKGSEQAQVSAAFAVPHDHISFSILKESDIKIDPTESLVLRRTLGADGRSKAYINDQPVSVALMKQIGQSVLEIHGQFDTQGLLDPATHRGLLDDYAAVDNNGLALSWNAWQDALRAYQALQEESEKSRHDEDYLKGALEDIDALAPEAGEEDRLDELRGRLMHRTQILEALNNAYGCLRGERDPVRQAAGLLDRISDKMGEAGAPILDALDRASAEIEEAVALIQSVSADMDEEEHNLETIDDRLYALRAQARKHQCSVDELPAKREELAQRLNRITHSDSLLIESARAVEKSRQAYILKAQGVRAQRQKAAEELDNLVMKELAPLKLERAQFKTQIDPLEESEWGANGMDRVRFLVATNPGAEPGPLHKIASGGEMARFMLALKVVMAETGTAQTLIFDEVDAGIGGAVADAVGERLARLSKQKQILVVTHSPQVAARADHHWIVRKDGAQSVTTHVTPLAARVERCEEIARMLSGATITPEARAAADKLLEASAA